MVEGISVAAVILMMATSLVLLVNQKWRIALIALAVQYFMAFWLVNLVWSFGLASVKLVVGLMVCAVLGSTQVEVKLEDQMFQGNSGAGFRILMAAVVWIFVFAIAPSLANWITTGMVILWGGLLLIGMGLLQLGMTGQPVRVIIGLLTMLSGFEVLYASVETSVLVTGLLALVNLALALMGAYLLLSPGMEEE